MTISWRVEVFDSLPSTQDLAIVRAEEGAPEGAVVQALVQSQGRGRHGNAWISPLGNLYMSFLLKPACKPDMAGQVSFVMALALSAAIDPWLASTHKKTLKWPNDILIDGKKCAGILLESSLSPDGIVENLVIGIGVNIHTAPPEGIALQDIAGEKRIAVHRFRDDLLAQIADFYAQWKADGFTPIRQGWLRQAHALNHKISARLPDRTEKGIFRDIGPDGALVLETSNGKSIAIRAGDVYFGG